MSDGLTIRIVGVDQANRLESHPQQAPRQLSPTIHESCPPRDAPIPAPPQFGSTRTNGSQQAPVYVAVAEKDQSGNDWLLLTAGGPNQQLGSPGGAD
jgi:hypothetical protein